MTNAGRASSRAARHSAGWTIGSRDAPGSRERVEQERAIALHEAAHAVIARRLGRWFDVVRLTNGNGYVSPNAISGSADIGDVAVEVRVHWRVPSLTIETEYQRPNCTGASTS